MTSADVLATRDFFLGLVISVVILSIFIVFAPGAAYISGVLFLVGVVTWLAWHGLSMKVARLLVLSDIKGKDVGLYTAADYALSPLSFKSLLKRSLRPALLAFSVASLAYQALGWDATSVYQLGRFMFFCALILPFSVFVAAIWIIDDSEIVVAKLNEDFPRSVAYFEYLDSFIDMGAFIGLVLTVARTVASSSTPSAAFAAAVVAPLFLVILLVGPSLVSTALFFRFSYVKRVYRFREKLKPVTATAKVEFIKPSASVVPTSTASPTPQSARPASYCVNCGAPILEMSKYCRKCGATQQ